MSYEEYTWERYYEDIYHRQKKLNNTLAVELGEITAKMDELNVALNRVTGSSLWRALAPARKLYHLIRKDGGAGASGAAVSASGAARSGSAAGATGSVTAAVGSGAASAESASGGSAQAAYAGRLEEYEDYYGQWIRRDPVENRYADFSESGMTRVRESRFHIVLMEDCGGMRAPFDASIRAPWILFTTGNVRLASGYAERLESELEKHPEALIAYADEDYYYTVSPGRALPGAGGSVAGAGGSAAGAAEASGTPGTPGTSGTVCRRLMPDFKPDWSPDTLDSFFYFGNIALIRTDTAIRADWYGSKNGYANVYDLFLQVSDRIGEHYDEPAVVHIPQVLAHNCVDGYLADNGNGQNIDSYELWSTVSDRLKEDLEAGRLMWGASPEYDAVKLRSFKRRGIKASFIPGQYPDDHHICYALPAKHRVSVLILSKDHPELVRKLLSTFTERTDYDDLEFIVVDNGSDSDNRARYMEIIDELAGDYPHEYIYEPREFNFSALCNRAAAAASGDLLLFMNDDIEVVQKDWLRLMAGYAFRPYIGAVGAKLLYADSDLIQHVGITSMEIGPSHKLVMYPDDRIYYYGRNTFAYDMLGVTAACLLIQTSKFDGAGGFDESFPVAYNDVELNMKLARSGLVNLQCNGALLYHHESMTRGLDEGSDEKWNRLLNEKDRLYKIYPEFLDEDPFYNPNLVGNHSNYLSNFDYGYNNHTKCESVRQIDASELAETPADHYKISIDFAGVQPKIRLEEPEIIEIRGWSFISGGDNSLHHVSLILKNNTDGHIYRVKTDPMPRKDLEETFPDELNNRLCGFEARVLKDDLAAGEYSIGIEPLTLNHDLNGTVSSGKVVYTECRISATI